MSFDNIVQSFTNTNFQDADNALSQTDNIDYEGDNQQRKRISKQQQTILIELENIDKQYNLNIAQTYKNITKGFIFYNEDEPIEYITITRGCPYKCSYCSIPVGRGGEYNSVPLGDIIDKINSAKIKNINKILLLGDEIGNYGLGTNGLDLSELLNHILKDKSLKLAIRYLEPKPFLQHYQTIKKYCENGQIQLLYLPLQSGSNKILKLMNRSYEINNDLIEKILYLKKNTNVIFYTNWMVGFNSETDIDFQSTIDLVKQLDLHINTIIPFSERPNTKATEISNKITIKDKEIRYKKLFNIVQNLKRKRLALGLKSIGNIKREDIINRIIEAEDTSMQFD
ncbi:MAG: hypothetical protein DRG78_03625 [Epsilonproteobacteria bacterium]|nr:MAG: hypothetical protein DRG78_03625 [Campylobacterota bacterium]